MARKIKKITAKVVRFFDNEKRQEDEARRAIRRAMSRPEYRPCGSYDR